MERTRSVSAGRPFSSEGVVQHIRYRWCAGKKEMSLNESPVRDRKELVELLPCIPFAHDDINFVQGPPEMQRFFFDQILSLYDPYFIDVLRSYRKLLRQRNAVLKGNDHGLLSVYDEHLAAHGLTLQQRRSAACERFSRTFSTLFAEVSGLSGSLRIEYRPSWPPDANANTVQEELARRRDQDAYMRTTTSGPHRDRFLFFWDDAEFTRVASTGQVRLASLLLRVSQAQFFTSQTERKALLLLDDVLLELDPVRRARFFGVLPAYEQAFFTFLPDEHFTRFRKAGTLLYRVLNGSVTPYDEGVL